VREPSTDDHEVRLDTGGGMLLERRPVGVARLGGVRGMADWLLMTCAADGHEHWVGDDVCGAHRLGRYPALCGRLVISAALAAPGPACQACAAVLAESHQQRRSRKTDVLVQMTGLASRGQGKHRRDRTRWLVTAW
jgi:hypothetical protein